MSWFDQFRVVLAEAPFALTMGVAPAYLVLVADGARASRRTGATRAGAAVAGVALLGVAAVRTADAGRLGWFTTSVHAREIAVVDLALTVIFVGALGFAVLAGPGRTAGGAVAAAAVGLVGVVGGSQRVLVWLAGDGLTTTGVPVPLLVPVVLLAAGAWYGAVYAAGTRRRWLAAALASAGTTLALVVLSELVNTGSYTDDQWLPTGVGVPLSYALAVLVIASPVLLAIAMVIQVVASLRDRDLPRAAALLLGAAVVWIWLRTPAITLVYGTGGGDVALHLLSWTTRASEWAVVGSLALYAARLVAPTRVETQEPQPAHPAAAPG